MVLMTSRAKLWFGVSLFAFLAFLVSPAVSFGAGAAPVAQGQSQNVPMNGAQTFVLSATDADATSLSMSIVAAPAHGTLGALGPVSCVAGASKSGAPGVTCTVTVTYTATAGYAGPDAFTFKANDGTADSNIAQVSITVFVVGGGVPPTGKGGQPQNIAPVAA